MGNIQSQQGPTAGKALSPENFVRDFGAKTQLARYGVRTLYEALLSTGHPTALAAIEQWKTLFGRASGCDLGRPSAAIEKLAEGYGVKAEGLKPDAMLFALHTYYAIFVKLLLGRVMAFSQGPSTPTEKLLFFRGDPFSWYTGGWSAPIERLIRQLAAALAQYDPGTRSEIPAGGSDLLGQLYQKLLPRPLRHELGEYYTPGWLADHVLEVVGYTGNPQRRLLDPACGSGTFLVKAIHRVRAWCEANREQSRLSQGDLCRNILANVVGFDLNPSAVLAARANYLIAIRDLLPHVGRVQVPVHLCDSILDGPESAGVSHRRFDYVVGNPPWIAWDNLPADYRRATKPLWERYGLFTLSGKEGRHGGGKKDLSMLMIYTSADRYLKDGGRLAMVITQTLFQTKEAGDGFRRFRLGPEGEWLKVLRVDDMVAVRPFQDAANFTSTILLEKGSPTRYPVPYVKWSPGEEQFKQRTYQAQPIDLARPGSPWFLRPAGMTTELTRLVGPSDYVAHLGANSGGANGVYWVKVLGEEDGGVLVRNIARKSKRGVEVVQQVVEPHLLYPLLRWAGATRYHALPSAHILLTQDVATRTGIDQAVMRREYPRTYAYLRQFERVLTDRSAYKRYQSGKPFYSMYNVGTYTVAPIKVVWRRMDRRLGASVVGEIDHPLLGRRPVIPQETCVLIACNSAGEAHYVCAVLNSSVVNFLVTGHSVCGGKGFGTPSMLDFVKLRRFNPNDRRHEELAACSRQAHQIVAEGISPHIVQRRIDRLAGQLWRLDEDELEVIETA